MSTAIQIRKATEADEDATWRARTASIRCLCTSHYGEQLAEAWASAPRPDDFVAIIQDRDFLVAEFKSGIVGFGFIHRQHAEMEALFVAPDFARRGIGTALLAALEAKARQAGLKRLSLSSSLNAVSFYEVAGYLAIEETTWHHPAGFNLRCVEMAKALTPA